jgi:hypothetical protein
MSHIAPISLKVQATLAAYRIVTMVTGTSDICKYPSAATDFSLGITADTVLDTTASIPVYVAGIAKLAFNASCAAGALVAPDSSGYGVPHTNTTAGSYVIGVALQNASTGTVAQVLIQPIFKSIP